MDMAGSYAKVLDFFSKSTDHARGENWHSIESANHTKSSARGAATAPFFLMPDEF